MLFQENLVLKGINPEWAERRVGFRKVAYVHICFVPVLTYYDDDPYSSNSFSLSPNLSATPKVKIAKSKNKSGGKVPEKEYK